MVAAATCDAFLTQLAYMMATEAPVTLTKVGTTFPEEMFPGLPVYKQFRKPK